MENNLNEVSNFDQLMQKYLKDQKQILTEIDYKTPLKEISPIEPLIFKNEPMSMNNNNSKKINNIEPIYDNENIESYNYKLNQNYHNMNNYPYINNDNDMNENKFITPIKPINQKISKSYINSSIEREKLAKEEKKKKQLEYQKMLDEQIKEKKERQRKEREKRLLEEKNFEEKFKLENEIYEQPIKISNKKYRNISNIFSEEIEPNNNNNNININNLNNNNNINMNNINYNNNINEEQEYEQNYQNELNNNNRMIRRTKSQPHFEVMNNKLFQPINNPNFQNPPPYPDIDSQQNSNSNPNLIQPQIPIEHLVSTSTQIPNQFLTPANQNNYLFPAYKTQNNYYPSSRQSKNINLNYNQNIQNPSQDINQYLTQRQYNEYHPPKLQQPISSDLGSNTNISISPSNFPTCYQMPFNNNLMNSSPNVNFNNNSQNVNELFNMNMNNMNNINNQNYFKIIEMFFHEQEKIMESYKETIEKLKNERDEALYRNRANEQKILALEKMQKDKELLEKNLGYFPFKNGYQQNEIKGETQVIEETKKEEKKELSSFSDFEIVTEEIKKDNKKEENNMNSKEYIKLKTVLINSFVLEKKPEQETKEKKNNKENDNEFILVDKNEQECEEMLNNAYKKGKCSEINKYKDELNVKKKVKRFHLFNYNCEDPSENKIIYKLGKVLVFTYRKNFPKITSYKTKKTFTTDAWWGCMVRCGQMILSRGIYRILKSTGMNTKSAIYFTSSLFNNYPIQTKFLHQYFHGMITKYKTLSNFDEKGDMEIKEFFPPFSIRTLCDVGELFERTAGEWFSDVIITGVFKKISEFFELFQDPKLNVKIMKYQSCIEIPDILEKCFVQKKYNKNDNNYIHFNKKYYYFDKMGIIFVNVRVGLDKIPKQYFEGIKELFTLKECIGIIGGKSRLAYYFIGYNNDDNSLLYLDPHVSKEAHKKYLFSNILDKHVNKEIHQLKMSKMSTAFTIGFCFRNYKEFLKLYEFWQTAKQKELPILGMVKQNLVLVEKYKEKEEDYSPTYEDKDDDDF